MSEDKTVTLEPAMKITLDTGRQVELDLGSQLAGQRITEVAFSRADAIKLAAMSDRQRRKFFEALVVRFAPRVE